MTVLRADNLTKSYGQTPALRGVSVRLEAGEILAVTGRSGCGKSTLLHCMAGIVRPDSGEVHYHDERLDTRSETRRAELRRTEFGVLFQFGQLTAELTAAENVALPLLLAGQRRRAARATALEWLDRVGVADVADRVPGELSGGQQQRCAVARCLVTAPRVVFADEPTGALDSLTGERVLGLLVTTAREEGSAVLLVTHDARVAAYADREVILRDGVVDPSGLGVGGLVLPAQRAEVAASAGAAVRDAGTAAP